MGSQWIYIVMCDYVTNVWNYALICKYQFAYDYMPKHLFTTLCLCVVHELLSIDISMYTCINDFEKWESGLVRKIFVKIKTSYF